MPKLATEPKPESGSSHVGPMVDDRPPEPVDPAFRDMVLQGLDDIRRGDIATDDEVEAIFARFRR